MGVSRDIIAGLIPSTTPHTADQQVLCTRLQARVVRRQDNAIQLINRYSLDNC